MHQHPRPAPRSSSSASNRTTNPERTNNQRDRPPQRTRSSVDLASYTERAGGEPGGSEPPRNEGGAAAAGSGSGQDRETTKLNQIIQHFHSKAALMICSARANLPQVHARNGEIKQNRWFNIVLDDTDVLVDHLQEWKRPDLADSRPPPLVIEVYVDTSNLRENQALVIVDDAGKRWDVSDALAGSADSSPRPPNKSGGKYYEVVLERWTIELGDAAGYSAAELNDGLPNVYKKGVVLFRSLYTFLRFLPAWKLHRRLGRQPGNQQALKLKYRIRQGGQGLAHGQKDALFTPLCPAEANARTHTGAASHDATNHVQRHDFQPLACPAGPLRMRVDYRVNQDLAACDAEALLSSRFLGLDEGLPTLAAGRSLPGARTQPPPRTASSSSSHTRARTQYGSATEQRTSSTQVTARQPRALLGAYGSLGTYHTTDRRESPLSHLHHEISEDDSDMEDHPTKLSNEDVDRNAKGRRTSDLLKNSPFTAGSLGDHPAFSNERNGVNKRFAAHRGYEEVEKTELEGGMKPGQGYNVETFAAHAKANKESLRAIGRPKPLSSTSSKRISLNTLPQQALRAPSIPNETAIASSSGSSSPRPAPLARYSSSFADRPKRPASTTSATNQSGGSGESSTAPKDDGDSLTEWIKELEATKSMKLTQQPTQAYSVDLAQYSRLRDPNAALADDMASSSLLQASNTPPSRRLSNVPGLSTSSSPSRAAFRSIKEEEGGAKPEEEGAEEEEPQFLFHQEL
ncbi:hypothetical protein LTR36_006534 [Oleoguttula mirabilis]|uniref:Autophagy-related protein 13 n=1 Tax=Oleoguttula mirabilis TaxID=1507867 RepID=A0AAV9JUY4_9PEZI|nr:hypothetical protein LTR36_006534 [Oleoguttula mirabilis]